MKHSEQLHSAFDRIKASEQLKNSTMDYVNTVRSKQRSCRGNRMLARAAVAVCTMLIVFFSVGNLYIAKAAVSYISVDAEPFIELSLNRHNKVIEANIYDEKGQILVGDLEVKGHDYKEAVVKILETSTFQNYIEKGESVTFSVASESEELENQIIQGIEHCSKARAYPVETCSVSMEDVHHRHRKHEQYQSEERSDQIMESDMKYHNEHSNRHHHDK